MENNKQQTIWMSIVAIVGTLTLIFIGYGLGFVYTDKGCTANPLMYGLEKLNELNEEEFTCECYSSFFSAPLVFNSEEIISLGGSQYGGIKSSTQNLSVNLTGHSTPE